MDKPKLITVKSSELTDPDNDGYAMEIIVDFGDGKGEQTVPFGYREADPSDMAGQVRAWLKGMPDFDMGVK